MSRRRAARLVPLCIASLASLASLAPSFVPIAEAAPKCDKAAADCALAKGDIVEDDPHIFPPRHWETWANVPLLIDFYGGPHAAFGLAHELSYSLDRWQRTRFGVFGVLPLIGTLADGDWDTPAFSMGGGASFRQTLFRADLFDVLASSQLSVLATYDPRTSGWRGSMRAGFGPGVRLGRHVQLEAMWMPTVFMTSPITTPHGRTQSAFAEGFVVQLGFDICGVAPCDVKPRKQVKVDLACQVYDKASEVCAAARQPNDKQSHEAQKKEAQGKPKEQPVNRLCSAVDAALDAQAVASKGSFDPTDAAEDLLVRVIGGLSDDPLQKAVKDLLDMYRKTVKEWQSAHDADVAARSATPRARYPLDVRDQVYVAELRRVLGCAEPASPCPVPACTPYSCPTD